MANAVFRQCEILPIVECDTDYKGYASSSGIFCKLLADRLTADGRNDIRHTRRPIFLTGQVPRMLLSEIFKIMSAKEAFVGGIVTILQGQSTCPDGFEHMQLAVGARGALVSQDADTYYIDQTMQTFFARKEGLSAI